MILPQQYEDKGIDAYLQDCTNLLSKYEWVYNFQLTKFFTDKVWQNFPEEVCQTLSIILIFFSPLPVDGFIFPHYCSMTQKNLTIVSGIS